MKINDILTSYSEYIDEVIGDKNKEFEKITSFQKASSSSIVYITNEKYLEDLKACPAKTVIIGSKLKELIPTGSEITYIFCSKPDVLVAKILQDHFHIPSEKNMTTDQYQQISEKAEIHPSASIGPFCVIEEGVKIGENTIIGASNHIAKNTVIKNHCLIGSHNYIAANTLIDDHCKISSHNSIGVPAYSEEENIGFIPSHGNIHLKSSVEMGAGNVIELGIVNTSIIDEGTKLDNHVFIGSESHIGAHSFLTANTRVCHHVSTGHHFVMGGNSSVSPRVKICDMVQIAGLSLVEEDIPESGAYGGHPLQKMRDYLKTSMSLIHIAKMRKEINQLIKNES